MYIYIYIYTSYLSSGFCLSDLGRRGQRGGLGLHGGALEFHLGATVAGIRAPASCYDMLSYLTA